MLENGIQQNIVFFTSDPFPISAALILDVNLPNTALDRIKETFSALAGAFSEFDELAVYTYSNTVRVAAGFPRRAERQNRGHAAHGAQDRRAAVGTGRQR